MQVFYGTPLPPGLVAPTQGELRLRIDQLLLDDDAINHNPLVDLFDGVATATDTTHGSDGTSATVSRSPNRFVVPVDYCAVGPIFWGETRPTTQGQPSTPQLRRGPLTLAYPIKVDPRQFAAYLERMTASPQAGVQLDVFVPSSYSGRPPVTVGKARLALDQLQPGRPIHGWIPVLHRRSRVPPHSANDGSAAAVREIPVGKVKVSVSVEYYPSTRHTSQQQQQQPAGKHHRHSDVSGNGVFAKTRRSGRGGTEAAAYSYGYDVSAQSASSSSDVEGGRDVIQLRGGDRLRVRHRLSAGAQDLSSVTQSLLEQGFRLRAQMDAAARGAPTDAALGFLDGKYTVDHPSAQGSNKGRDESAQDGISAAVPLHESGSAAADHVEDVEDAEDSVYTSEASDEENFALQLQKDSEARDSRATQSLAHAPRERRDDQASMQYSQVTAKSTVSASGSAPASVELCCSHFTFAQTPATADLHQLRLSVRLSSDITTTEPTPGPLSSYVHPVPFQQPSICLHFDVCSYSEDRSKLVVEVYKVVSDVEVADDEEDAWEVRGPRHVSREELLGLSVVGLYRQTREIAFRDPVMNTTNVFAQLDVRLSQPGAEEGGGLRSGAAAAVSPRMTPASEGPPPSSIAGSSRQQQQQQQQPMHPAKPLPERVHSMPATASPPRQQEGEGSGMSRTSQFRQAARDFSSAAAVPASPPPPLLTAVNASLVASERRRLRVVVHSAVELPRVAVARQSNTAQRPSARFPLVSSNPRLLPDAGVDSAHRYTDPSSFVTVEEIYQSTQRSLTGTERRTEEPTPKTRACMQGMANWYVDEARSGYYDRSAVAEQSCNPHYDYEVILQLPDVSAAASAEEVSTHSAAGVSAVKSSLVSDTVPHRGGATAEVLEEVQLNVWHSDPVRRTASEGSSHTTSVRAKAREQEVQFWTCAAYMGTCRIDLRPLRYLPMINGYYRVVCERTPHNATDETAIDTDANTIGYMRVSVSLL